MSQPVENDTQIPNEGIGHVRQQLVCLLAFHQLGVAADGMRQLGIHDGDVGAELCSNEVAAKPDHYRSQEPPAGHIPHTHTNTVTMGACQGHVSRQVPKHHQKVKPWQHSPPCIKAG